MFDATQMILRLEDWCYRETFWPRLLQDGVLFEGLHVLIGQRQVPPNLLDWVKDSQREFPQDSKRYQVARALICCAHLAEQLAKTVQNQAIPFGEVDEALIALKDMPDECIEDWCYRETFWPRLLQDGVLFEGLHVLVGQRQVPPNLLDWVKDSQREFPQDLKRYQVARALICCAHLAEQPAKTVQNQAIPFGEVDEALIALKDMPDECIPPRQESWARGCIYSFLTPPRWLRRDGHVGWICRLQCTKRGKLLKASSAP